MPDFQQFADKLTGMIGTGTGNFVRSVYLSDIEQAERHARLLQQIWEWANCGIEEPSEYNAIRIYGHDATSQQHAKAHVRSLLVSQTEEK